MSNPFISGFSKVQAGWTGVVSVTVGSATASITPSSIKGSGRTSVAEVVLLLVEEARDKIGGTWTVFPDSSGRVTIRSSNSFTMNVTLNTLTRTGFSVVGGATTSVRGTAHANGIYPSSVSVHTIETARQKAGLAISGTGATSTLGQSSSHTISVFDTWENCHTYMAALYPEGAAGTHDLWCTDRMLGRYKITGSDMEPRGRLLSHWKMSVFCRGSE